MVMDCRALRSSLGERAVMSCPSTRTVPSVGFSSRFMQRTSVLFPAPERPMMPKISPFSMLRSMPSSAVTAASPWPKVFRRPRISMMGSLIESLLSNFRGAQKNAPDAFLSSIKGGAGSAVPPCFVRTSRYEPFRVQTHSRAITGAPVAAYARFPCGRCATPRPCSPRPSVPVFTLRALFAVPPRVLFSSSSLRAVQLLSAV